MATTKRSVAFKDVVAEPLNWKVPKPVIQDADKRPEAQPDRAEQGSEE